MLNYRCLAFISLSLSHIGPLTGNMERHIINSVEFFWKIKCLLLKSYKVVVEVNLPQLSQ